MANIIKIKEFANKLSYDYKIPIVCGNTNYEIEFDFSEAWASVEKKTAIFLINGKKMFVEFTGNRCKMPSFPNSYFCMLMLTASPGGGEYFNTNELVLNLTYNELGNDVQLMDPFVGYYSRLLEAIKKCEDGDISVKMSDFAKVAENAQKTDFAETCNTATHSEPSTTSNFAETSETANFCETCNTATFAENSNTANHSTTSDSANHSATSDSSTYAETSGFATTSNRSETQVSLTGDETISGEKNFVDNLKKKGENVLNKKEVANENILLNGDFSINQRGQTSYSGENVYSVDRWKLGDALANATQDENGKWKFSIAGATENDARILLMYTLENVSAFAGQKLTASLKFKDLIEDVPGTLYMTIFDGVNSSGAILSESDGFVEFTHDVSENATMFSIMFVVNEGKNCSFTPIYCKLELGENATMFMPRQPSEELWLCQRYFQSIKLEGQACGAANLLVVQPTVILNNTLRAKPTMTIITYPGVWTSGYSYRTNNVTFKYLNYNAYGMSVEIVSDSNKPDLTTYATHILRNGLMTLDAEIY